ncbi:MAG: hypothetical protein WCR30_05095 [Clostridia bacterium]
MKYYTKETTCSVCNQKSKQTFCFVEEKDNNLENLCNIVWIQQCPHCFYASQDISKPVKESIVKLVSSEKYQSVANYNLDYSPLATENFHRFYAYSLLCKEIGLKKESIFSMLKAMNIKLNVAYEIMTDKFSNFSSDDWGVIAEVYIAEVKGFKEECYNELYELSNEKPLNGAIILLLLKNVVLDKEKIENCIDKANFYLGSENAKQEFIEAIKNEIISLENILKTF